MLQHIEFILENDAALRLLVECATATFGLFLGYHIYWDLISKHL